MNTKCQRCPPKSNTTASFNVQVEGKKPLEITSINLCGNCFHEVSSDGEVLSYHKLKEVEK